jgi:hypothetical protein
MPSNCGGDLKGRLTIVVIGFESGYFDNILI